MFYDIIHLNAKKMASFGFACQNNYLYCSGGSTIDTGHQEVIWITLIWRLIIPVTLMM